MLRPEISNSVTNRLIVGVLLSVFVGFSSPAARAQVIQLEEVGQIPGPVELVRVSGQFAYVSGGHTFTVYDLSIPSMRLREVHTYFQRKFGVFVWLVTAPTSAPTFLVLGFSTFRIRMI